MPKRDLNASIHKLEKQAAGKPDFSNAIRKLESASKEKEVSDVAEYTSTALIEIGVALRSAGVDDKIGRAVRKAGEDLMQWVQDNR